MHIPEREDPGLVGLCDDDEDSCLKNSLGFMERWDTNAAASCGGHVMFRVGVGLNRVRQLQMTEGS